MKLAVISNVGGHSWAGSRERWCAVARLNLQKGAPALEVCRIARPNKVRKRSQSGQSKAGVNQATF